MADVGAAEVQVRCGVGIWRSVNTVSALGYTTYRTFFSFFCGNENGGGAVVDPSFHKVVWKVDSVVGCVPQQNSVAVIHWRRLPSHIPMVFVKKGKWRRVTK